MLHRRARARSGMTMPELATVLTLIAVLAAAAVIGSSSLRSSQQDNLAPVTLAGVHHEVVSLAASPEFAFRLPDVATLTGRIRTAAADTGPSADPDEVSVHLTDSPDGVVLAVYGTRSCAVVWERFSEPTVWATDRDADPAHCTGARARAALAAAPAGQGSDASSPWTGLDLAAYAG